MVKFYYLFAILNRPPESCFTKSKDQSFDVYGILKIAYCIFLSLHRLLRCIVVLQGSELEVQGVALSYHGR